MSYISKTEPIKKSETSTCAYVIKVPRGILYHRYTVNKQGSVIDTNLVTPTVQDIVTMEEIELSRVLNSVLGEDIIETPRRVAVAFDPCTPCSLHSTPVKIEKN
jgi:sulfhydrogenase subunit alpha